MIARWTVAIALAVVVVGVFAFREEIFQTYALWRVGGLAGEIKDGSFERTAVLGGGGGGPFDDIPREGALLTGVQVTTSSHYGGHLVVKSLQPIFLSGRGRVLGDLHGVPHGPARVVEARAGYAVGGFVAKTGHRVDGFRIVFRKIGADGLNANDIYESEWIGGGGGGGERTIDGEGRWAIGIHGRQGQDLDSFGLVLSPPATQE